MDDELIQLMSTWWFAMKFVQYFTILTLMWFQFVFQRVSPPQYFPAFRRHSLLLIRLYTKIALWFFFCSCCLCFICARKFSQKCLMKRKGVAREQKKRSDEVPFTLNKSGWPHITCPPRSLSLFLTRRKCVSIASTNNMFSDSFV